MKYTIPMHQRVVRVAMIIGLILSPIVCATAAHAQTTMPAYPEGVAGLTQLFNDLLDASAKQDVRKALILSQSLVLPKSEEWFTKTFGKELGTKLNKTYQEEMVDFGPKLARLFLSLAEPKALKVEVVKVEAADDPQAKAYQALAINEMQAPVALYSVSVRKEGTTANIQIWSIVYVDHQYRMVGRMQGVYENSSKRAADKPK